MRTFKISRKSKGGFGRNKKQAKHAKQEGVHKARLKRSGLWDGSAVKSKLVVYRIGQEPSFE